MVFFPSLLFVRRRRQTEIPEQNNKQSQIKSKQSKKKVKNEAQSKRSSTKQNKATDEDNKRCGKQRFYQGSKCKGNEFGSINKSKFIILQLALIREKASKCLKNIFRRHPKLRKGTLHKSPPKRRSNFINCQNIYDIYANKGTSLDDDLSCVTSVTDIWIDEWNGSKSVITAHDSSRDKHTICETYIKTRICSKDTLYFDDLESEDDFYSALQSIKSSPTDQRYRNVKVNHENRFDFNYLHGKENGLDIFLEAGYKIQDLLEMGCDVRDMLDCGCDVKSLLEAGCAVKDLIEAGCKVCDLLQSGCKVKDILCSVENEKLLLDEGFSVQDLVLHKSRVEELLEPKPEKQEDLQCRLKAGEDLYPACDVSVWLRTCKKEVLAPLSGTTTGTIPKWLKGTLLRNGPGSLQVGNEQFEHLFDGSALIHRFGIENGEVKYQCKFIETNTYKKNHAAQRIVVTEFGTAGVPDPCQSIFQRISVLFNPGETMSDNAMISVYPFGDEFYAFAENTVIHRIDPLTLDTKERVNVSKHINIVNHTSHPHVLRDGCVYNLGISIKCTGPQYSIVKFPPAVYTDVNGLKRTVKSPFEQAQIVASVPAHWKFNPSYMHTFGITENYFVIVEQPLSISFSTMFRRHMQNLPMAPSLKWQKNEQTRIHLLNRKTGQPAGKFLADAFFYLHIINQYEEENHLVLDISCYKDATMLDCMYINSLREASRNLDYAEMFRGRPLRFVLPLTHPAEDCWGTNLVSLPGSKATAYKFMDNTIFVCPELICDLGCETPRIHYEKHLGKPYRYFYAISSDVDLDNPGTLIKVDTLENKTKTWCEDNIFPSEPVFVPSPHSNAEDDGVVLSALVWTKGMENKVGLLILDAKTWTELGRTVFLTPSPVPKCLHGWFTSYC